MSVRIPSKPSRQAILLSSELGVVLIEIVRYETPRERTAQATSEDVCRASKSL